VRCEVDDAVGERLGHPRHQLSKKTTGPLSRLAFPSAVAPHCSPYSGTPSPTSSVGRASSGKQI
jgi:hypothetical protein